MTRAIAILAAFALAQAARAQPSSSAPPPIVFDVCEKPAVSILKEGDTALVRCKEVAIANARYFAGLEAERAAMADALALLKQGKAIDQDIAKQLDAKIAAYQRIEVIQNASYDRLKASFDALAVQTKDSVDNTRQALKLVHRTALAGLVASGLTGAAAGGLAGLQVRNEGGAFAIGAAAGAVAGLALNWWLLP
ncbi:MAG TPA: hypothetical protein VIW03_03990 [Anaeromyxobacter sp.]